MSEGRSTRIEDYALIGNSQSSALVGRDGSIDWLCLPRFDSPACFAALVGTSENGRWKIAPAGPTDHCKITRHYQTDTLILETHFETPDGAQTRVIDFMVPEIGTPILVRIVEGLRGKMAIDLELVLRFDYGALVPWVRKRHNGEVKGITAICGPDTVCIHTHAPLRGENFRTLSNFEVREGDRVPFVLAWHPSHEHLPAECEAVFKDPCGTLEKSAAYWKNWSARSTYQGEWKEAVERSILTLKALTHSFTGGIVAAPTTSLPEALGGVRNWDYRYCWLRDATFTLMALASAGHYDEAQAWRDWLIRAVAGKPSDLRIMYGLAGERRLPEYEVPWLPGYEGASPVRVGNAASGQMQLDVYGEVMDALHMARQHGGKSEAHDWRVQRKILDFLSSVWDQPDHGIWEVRGPQRHFTHSKVMAWVAVDRGIKAVESGLEGPLEKWKALRAQIHEQVLREGFNQKRNSFVQYFGSEELDASLLLLPLVGFLPATDPRMRATIEAIERELMVDGFVLRYKTEENQAAHVDGLPPGEGAFLACSFWLAHNLKLLGRDHDARLMFERLLSIRNDVGLLPEEYDSRSGRFTGNFPQAFSHVALVNCAVSLSSQALDRAHTPPLQRSEQAPKELKLH
jgi:GH15 family glucan-1,4-alpha-glucosidase